jgi:nucleoside 2-deoxyribosyltransferase
VDQVEHVGKIDDEIMVQIRKSRFIVADFTGHRSGVYFEAGFALGLGLPVIWTCRKDELSKLHFDIRQYNCIDWVDAADLRKRLAFRIEAAVGVGPRRA